MDRIKEKLGHLRVEADAAVERAETAEGKVKTLEQVLLAREQDITSLQHRLSVAEVDLDKSEAKLVDAKRLSDEGESSRSTTEALQRKIQLLEEELDNAEKNVKGTVEKLRQVDIKAEHFERQVTRTEQERDQWEKKYEDMKAKYEQSKKDLDDLVVSMETI